MSRLLPTPIHAHTQQQPCSFTSDLLLHLLHQEHGRHGTERAELEGKATGYTERERGLEGASKRGKRNTGIGTGPCLGLVGGQGTGNWEDGAVT